MWASIKKIIPVSIKRLGLGHIIEIGQLCASWDEIICRQFGEQYKNKAKPVSLKNKTLIIDCLNSIWASELQLKKTKITEAINHYFGKDLVSEIKFIN